MQPVSPCWSRLQTQHGGYLARKGTFEAGSQAANPWVQVEILAIFQER